MAKTLNQFLEGYLKVKNPDEQKFVDKHVVAKHADRNGNDDEVFKGSKVKMADRRKDRHGYNPGEDEKVYEALKGSQHKIDANKNGKVDAHDFHLLRKKKKVAEETEDLDEAAKDKHFEKQSPKMQNAINLHLRKGLDYTSAVKAAAKHVKEEVEELEELSKETVRTYYNKAGEQGKKIADKMKMGGGDWSDGGSDTKTLKKRAAGRTMALKRRSGEIKMSEEIEELEELSAATKNSYAQKAGKQLPGLFKKSGETANDARKYYNRKNTVRKIANEEADQIDEILDTPEKAANYKAKAQKSFSKNVWISGDKAAHQTAKKRLYGLSHPKVAEEVEIEEKLNMDKASMGTVVKDFQKSDAPQFKGKSQDKRRAMAIAAKLTAERGGKPLRKEEKLANLLDDLTETHRRTMLSVFDKLNEDNQKKFLEACETPEGVESMLDFSISHRGE
jgi:hypothetical protein